MNYMQTIPIDMYELILYKLNVQELLRTCTIEKYSKNICNNPLFWKRYLDLNYDPVAFGLPSWDKKVMQNFWEIYIISTDNIDLEYNLWKDFVMLMVNGREVNVHHGDESFKIKIYFDTDWITIVNEVKKQLDYSRSWYKKMFSTLEIDNIQIIFNNRITGREYEKTINVSAKRTIDIINGVIADSKYKKGLSKSANKYYLEYNLLNDLWIDPFLHETSFNNDINMYVDSKLIL
jgi:hypothetical protein